eukprot:m.836273 g.836273  ORF g.836273 m.836273 type:complete len:107 (-) comp59483_c0_seq2:3241-3561(-)
MRGERIVRPRLQPTPPGAFESNAVRTSKYRWYDFVVKNLFEQFRRIANVYFLALVVLNWIPQLNVFGKQASPNPGCSSSSSLCYFSSFLVSTRSRCCRWCLFCQSR